VGVVAAGVDLGQIGWIDSMNYDAAAVVDKGEWMETGTVWLVCVEEGVRGVWVPRQDLPPAFDEDVARAFAAEQTILPAMRTGRGLSPACYETRGKG